MKIKFTWTVDGLCGWDIWTLVNCCPRSKALCCGISINNGVDFVVDDFWTLVSIVELIRWKAENEELSWFFCSGSSVEFAEKKFARHRFVTVEATIAVGRVAIPTGGSVVNTAGGVDCCRAT